jgi:hypothetical protein
VAIVNSTALVQPIERRVCPLSFLFHRGKGDLEVANRDAGGVKFLAPAEPRRG